MTMNNYFYNDIIKGKNKTAFNRPEQNFIKNLQVLKDLLIEDNYTNIKNLSQSNYNNNQIFSYLKGIIRKLILKNDKMTERVKQLERQIAKINPNNSVLHKIEEEHQSYLGEAGLKLHNFAPLKSRIADNFNKKFVQPTVFEQRSNPLITYTAPAQENRQNIKKQSRQIDRFISGELVKSLVVDKQKKRPIVKDMIVKLYLRWNDLSKRIPLVKSGMQIKAMITNELKKNFPNIDHNDKYYRGIAFRQDLVTSSKLKVEQQLSNRSVKSNDDFYQLYQYNQYNQKRDQFLKSTEKPVGRSSVQRKKSVHNQYVLIDDDYTSPFNKSIDYEMRQQHYPYAQHSNANVNTIMQEQNLLNDSDYYELLQFENTAIYPF